MTWRAWKPEFDSNRKLKEVLNEMPRDEADKVPWQVWLLENPDSPISFPGAITLYRHDSIHALLCASFYPEDEAFTIGYTMGASKWSNRWLLHFFLWLTTWFYPGEYRWTKDLKAHFMDGFNKAKNYGMTNINRFPFEEYEEVSLGKLRELVGIDWLKTPLNYEEWSKHWPPDRFEKYKHLKGLKPKPGRNLTTTVLRKTFRRRNYESD